VEEGAVTAERAAQGLAQTSLGGVGFRQLHDGHHQAEHSHHGEHDKHFTPAPQRNHQAAGQRRKDRRDAHYQHQQGHQARGFVAGVQVAHDGARNHHPGARPERLHRAKANQYFNARGQRATDAAHGKDHQAGIDRQLAPEHIADRAVEQLAHADDDEEHRQAHLHRRRRRLQAGAEGRQGRQVDVDGERPDGGDQPEQEGEVGNASRHGISGGGRAKERQLKFRTAGTQARLTLAKCSR